MTMSPRRVLLVLSEAGTGGMQAMVGVLAGGLADAGVEVHLAAGGDAPMPASVTEVVERGAAVLHRLPSPRGAGLLQWTLGLRTLCRKIRPEIVHGHGLRTAWPIAIVADRRRVLVTCHALRTISSGRLGSFDDPGSPWPLSDQGWPMHSGEPGSIVGSSRTVYPMLLWPRTAICSQHRSGSIQAPR